MPEDFSGLAEDIESDAEDKLTTDYDQRRTVRMSPFTVIAFEDIESVFYTGDITDADGNPIAEQSSFGDGLGSVGVTISGPSAVKGRLFANAAHGVTYVNEDDEEVECVFATNHTNTGYNEEWGTKDYYLVDPDDETTEYNYDQDGNLKSVKSGAAESFPSTEVEGFSDEEVDNVVTVYFNGAAALALANTLDVNGAVTAYVDDDGNNTNGLIEYNPEEGESGRRFAQYPELREDVDFSEGGFIALQRQSAMEMFDDDADGYYVYLGVGTNDGEQIAAGEGYDVLERTEGERSYNSTLLWHETPDDQSDADGPTEVADDGTDANRDDVMGADEYAALLDDEHMEFAERFIDRVGLEEGESIEDPYGGDIEKFAEVYEAQFDTTVTDVDDHDELKAVIGYIEATAPHDSED